MKAKQKLNDIKYRMQSKLENIARLVQNRPDVVHTTTESYLLTAKEYGFDLRFAGGDIYHKSGITDPERALNAMFTSCSLEKYQNMGSHKEGTAYFLYDGTYIRIDKFDEKAGKLRYMIDIRNKDAGKIKPIVNVLSQLGTLEMNRRETSSHYNIDDTLREFAVWRYVS